MSSNIYTYLEENFHIKSTYQFQQDYILHPLYKYPLPQGGCKIDLPYKEDLEYLLSIIKQKDIIKLLNICKQTLKRFINDLNLNNYFPIKINDDILKLYNINYNDFTRNYIIDPILVKGFTRKKFKNIINKEDIYFLYITKNISRQDIAKLFFIDEFIIKQWLKLYNIQKTKYQRISNMHKSIKTKFGDENIFITPYFKKKSEQTCLQKYGVKSYTQTLQYHNLYNNKSFILNRSNKEYITKKKNNSFATSKPEEEIYNLLCQKYGEIKRQYKSDLYPYRCDFYIPSIDTYIEYQGHWTHGKEPYIGSKEQQEKIILWKEKSNELNFKNEYKIHYSRAIHIWTISDPLKRNTAKKNNLNWIEFFNMNQFMGWFEKQ